MKCVYKLTRELGDAGEYTGDKALVVLGGWRGYLLLVGRHVGEGRDGGGRSCFFLTESAGNEKAVAGWRWSSYFCLIAG